MLKISLKTASFLLLALAWMANPGGAKSILEDVDNHDLRNKMVTLEASLNAMADKAVSAHLLLEDAGLDEIVNPQGLANVMRIGALPTAYEDAVDIQILDMRLALAMLSQAQGTSGNQAIHNAQTDGSNDAIILRAGAVTLADLKNYIRNYRIQSDGIDPDEAVTVPIVIWKGAALRMNAADHLNLSRTHGAFLINFGELDIQGGSISSVGAENPEVPSFNGFVVTAGSGVAKVVNGTFRGLGFGKTDKFSGFAALRNALLGVTAPSSIIDSLFIDLVSVSIDSLKGIEVSGNRFRAMRGTSLVMKRSKNALIERNIFFGDSPFNAVRVLNGSNNAVVRGNVVMNGERTGIVVRSQSDGATVSHNIVWRRQGGGITIGKSNCGRIHSNLILDNRRKGIEIRTSKDTDVVNNHVVGNKSAGIWISAQKEGWSTELSGNVLKSNGSGLSTATAALVSLKDNDFSDQTLRLLDGDFASQTRHLAMDALGKTAMTLTAFERLPFVARKTDCTD